VGGRGRNVVVEICIGRGRGMCGPTYMAIEAVKDD